MKGDFPVMLSITVIADATLDLGEMKREMGQTKTILGVAPGLRLLTPQTVSAW